jgi:hypothetical protein
MVTGLSFGLVACSDDNSATELVPEGPPMVRQLFVREKIFLAESVVEATGLAFGDHPDIKTPEESSSEGDDRMVLTARAFGGETGLRVVFDELLRGNHLEEIQCADETYSRVPVGATPDDIEACSGEDLSDCTAVCVGHMGIMDRNADGAVDDNGGYGYRMIDYGDGELGVSVTCDETRIPLVAVGRNRTFYNPSGNQLIPAGTGLKGLGPAMVVVPSRGFRTGSTCTLSFRPEVVDKDDNRICAPPGGDPRRECAQDGDTSAVQFRVEPLAFSSTVPKENETISTSDVVLLTFVAPVNIDTLGAITMTSGDGDPVSVSVTRVEADDDTRFFVNAEGGLVGGTDYTVTVGTGLEDSFGATPPEPLVLHFSTEAGAPDAGPDVDAGEIDAGVPDAAL